MDTGSLIRGVGFVFGGALFWIFYYDLKDRLRPEPRRLLVAAFLLGVAAAAASALGYALVDALNPGTDPAGNPAATLGLCLGLIGPLEEGTKFLALILIATRWKAFDEPVDGVVYAGAVSIGFATLENLLYLPNLTLIEQLARAATAPFTHSLFAGLYGYGVSRMRFQAGSGRARFLWPAGTFALASFLHGFYDYVIFAWNATVVAALIVLVLWAALLVLTRRLLPRVEAAGGMSDH